MDNFSIIACNKNDTYIVLATGSIDKMSVILDVIKQCLDKGTDIRVINIEEAEYAELKTDVLKLQDRLSKHFEF